MTKLLEVTNLYLLSGQSHSAVFILLTSVLEITSLEGEMKDIMTS